MRKLKTLLLGICLAFCTTFAFAGQIIFNVKNDANKAFNIEFKSDFIRYSVVPCNKTGNLHVPSNSDQVHLNSCPANWEGKAHVDIFLKSAIYDVALAKFSVDLDNNGPHNAFRTYVYDAWAFEKIKSVNFTCVNKGTSVGVCTITIPPTW